jgi:hypothetical protein
MKKPMTLAIVIALAIGYLAGHLHGHIRGYASGFSSGFYNNESTSQRGQAILNIRLLRACEKEDYSTVEYHVNSSLDSAILMLSAIDRTNPNMKMPRSQRKIVEAAMQVFEDAGIPTSTESTCKLIADFRAEHPSKSSDDEVLETISEFIDEYSKSTTSPSSETPLEGRS